MKRKQQKLNMISNVWLTRIVLLELLYISLGLSCPNQVFEHQPSTDCSSQNGIVVNLTTKLHQIDNTNLAPTADMHRDTLLRTNRKGINKKLEFRNEINSSTFKLHLDNADLSKSTIANKQRSRRLLRSSLVRQCTIPTFVSDWTKYRAYPIHVAESQGGMIGNEFVLFSGFSRVWSFVTNKTFAFNTSKPSNGWQEMDPIPVVEGLTHTGYVFHTNKIYACGGFIGGFPYATSDKCYMYTHSNPKGTQWTTFTSLPSPRTGGGMIYDVERNSLLFFAGASRQNKNDLQNKVDYSTVWEISLSDLNGTWTSKASIPYEANHIGFTSVEYEGEKYHYALGGQIGSNESYGNIDVVYQYRSRNDTWIQRQSMPFARGHFAGSVVPYSCGFIISGGAVNGGVLTDDISYYSIVNNNWTKIGNLPTPRNTPICAIHGGYYYCQSGFIRGSFSWRRRII